MQLGNVIGTVSTGRSIPCLQGQKFLAVEIDSRGFVAADLTGAAPGDQVLVVTGSTAARFCMEAPIDAAVVAIVDGV